MKFSVTSNELNKGLSAVIGAASTKGSAPILESILFEGYDGKLKLTATDNAIAIIEYIDADIEEEGAVAIPARRLLETLRQLANITIFFAVDDRNNVNFSTGTGNYKLVGDDSDDFPEVPTLEGGIEITATTEAVIKAIDKTLFAVSTDDLRPAMMGVLFKIGTEESKFVATDSYRLVEYTNRDINGTEPIDFIVPDKALKQIQKATESDVCEITVTDEHARFKYGNTIVITRLINEQYPNYDSVIPRENDKTMIIPKDNIVATVRRVSIFSSTTTRQIRLELSSDKLTIRAEDLDMSSAAKEVVNCEYSDEDFEIGFNAKFLGDVLNNIDDEEVKFEFSTPNRAGIVRPTNKQENEDILMVVMPVMLNSYS